VSGEEQSKSSTFLAKSPDRPLTPTSSRQNQTGAIELHAESLQQNAFQKSAMERAMSATEKMFCGLLCMLLAGCGRSGELKFEKAPVTGNVTYQGKPLESGMIRFIPDSKVVEGRVPGKPTFAKIEAGHYAIPAERGATVGKNRIEIVSYRKTGKVSKMEDTTIEETEQVLPDTYNTATTLSADVKPEANQLDFTLE
jgi:hypothetical protein